MALRTSPAAGMSRAISPIRIVTAGEAELLMCKPTLKALRQKATGPPARETTRATMAREASRGGRLRERRRKFLHGPHRVLPCSWSTQAEQKLTLQSSQVF